MHFLKQSTAATIPLGPFINAQGVVQTALGLTQADIRLKKEGGDAAQKSDATSCTHDESGIYDCALNATDTNTLGRLTVFINESGALPVAHDFTILPAQVYNSLILASEALNANVTTVMDEDATAFSRAVGSMELVTVGTSSTTTVVTSNLVETTNDHYKGRILVFKTGALARQASDITAYNGTTKAITVTALTEAPTNGDFAVIV